jgi:uncharacterized membrane protein
VTQSRRLERIVGIVLRAGVTASAACLAVGLVLTFVGVSSAAGVLLNVGVVVLLATPVARVVVSIAEYAAEREWAFVALTVTVLLELVASGIAAMYGRKL